MIILPRRKFLTGMLGLVAAPAVIKIASLMPVKTFATAEELSAIEGLLIYINEAINSDFGNSFLPSVAQEQTFRFSVPCKMINWKDVERVFGPEQARVGRAIRVAEKTAEAK